MNDKIEFFLDGSPVTVVSGRQSVRDLLKMTDKVVGGDYIVTREGIEYVGPDQFVEVRPGDKIETLRKPDRPTISPGEIRYQVNGEIQIATENQLSVAEIMRRAGASAAIDVDDLDSYLLEHVDGTKYDRSADSVTIIEGDEFLVIHRGATPVAWAP